MDTCYVCGKLYEPVWMVVSFPPLDGWKYQVMDTTSCPSCWAKMILKQEGMGCRQFKSEQEAIKWATEKK